MILHRYIARRFALSFTGTFAVFLAIMLLVDLVEQARRFGGDAGFGALLGLAALNLPSSLYAILPLITIIATITLFLQLSRSSELVVTRAAGRSALAMLLAPVVVILIVGALAVGLFNPVVAATAREYEARVDAIRGDDRILALAADGIWLRQGSSAGQTVIRAERTNLDGTLLQGATFFSFDAQGRPTRRIEAASARLVDGAWQVDGAKSWPLMNGTVPEAGAREDSRLVLPSTLTPDQIRAGFGAPESIAIWELPAFIARLEDAGFSARRHRVWLHSELAQPAFLAAMVLIGAAFTMRHQRGRRTGLMVLSAIGLSFGVYFLRNFARILGDNAEVSPALAAWAPPVAAVLLTLGLILHLEDG